MKEEDTTEAMDVDEEGDPDMMANRIAALKRKVMDVNAANRAAKKKIQDQQGELDELRDGLREAKTEITSWIDCADNYSAKTNMCLADSASYKRDLQELKTEHEELKDRYDQAQNDINTLEEQVRRQRERGDQLCDKVDDIQGALQHSKNANAMAARANASKDAKIAELTAALQTAKQQAQTVRPSRAADQNEVAELTQKITDLTKKNEDLDREKNVLKATYEQRAREILGLREANREAKAPPTVHITRGGSCYHSDGCNHLSHAGQPRAVVELRKCRDCWP